MIIRPDVVLYNILGAAWQIISQDTTVLAQIFATSSAAEITDIQTFFAQNEPIIKLGYIRAATDAGVGATYITVENEREVVQYQFLGSDAPLVTGDIETFGSYFETNTKLTCISTNANKTAYLAEITKYILLFNRVNLEMNYGLQEQSLSFSALAPEKSLEPDVYTFRRDVVLSSKQLDTADVTTNLGTLAKLVISPEASVDSSYQFNIP